MFCHSLNADRHFDTMKYNLELMCSLTPQIIFGLHGENSQANGEKNIEFLLFKKHREDSKQVSDD